MNIDKGWCMRMAKIEGDAEIGAIGVGYTAALRRIDELMDAEPGTPEAEELDRLVDAVEAHEDEDWPA